MSIAIQCRGVEKTFIKARSFAQLLTRPRERAERIVALKGVDLEIATGETLGLLGPNGAGKTTLIKICSCLVLPDRGQARVGGIDTTDENRVKRLVGLVHTDERSFYWRLSARENLRFFARLYDVPAAQIDRRIDALLETVQMDQAADRPFSGYSSGMKQRISIARALLHDPPILLMDEPTRSLDPLSTAAMRRFVRDELKGRLGKTILLATHDLAEAAALSDRVAILVGGRVRQIGSVDEIRRWGVSETEYVLEMAPGNQRIEGPFRVVSDATRGPYRRLHVALREGAVLEDLLRPVLAAGVGLHRCDLVEPDLEQAFNRVLARESGE